MGLCPKSWEDAKLKGLIDDIHTEFPYYGYRLLYEELKRRGIMSIRRGYGAYRESSVFFLFV